MNRDHTLLSVKQAADFLGRSIESFHYYIRIGRGPDYILRGKHKFYTPETLLLWKPDDRRKLNGQHLPRRKKAGNKNPLLAKIAELQTKIHQLQTRGDQE